MSLAAHPSSSQPPPLVPANSDASLGLVGPAPAVTQAANTVIQAATCMYDVATIVFPEPFVGENRTERVCCAAPLREHILALTSADPLLYTKNCSFEAFVRFSNFIPFDHALYLQAFRNGDFDARDMSDCHTTLEKIREELKRYRQSLIVLACFPDPRLRPSVQTSRNRGNKVAFAGFGPTCPNTLGRVDFYIDLGPLCIVLVIPNDPTPNLTFLPDVTAIVNYIHFPKKPNGALDVLAVPPASELGKKLWRLFAASCAVLEEVTWDLDSDNLALVLGQAGTHPNIDCRDFVAAAYHAGLIRPDFPPAVGPVGFDRRPALYDEHLDESLRLGGWLAILDDAHRSPGNWALAP